MPRSHTARRALLVARRRRAELEATSTKPAASRKRARPAWPSRITVSELDELGDKFGVEFAEGSSKAEKQAALEAAGVGPDDLGGGTG
jgi:hypothetical protein